MVAIWDGPAVAAGIRAQGRLRREYVESGHRLIGWKIGFASLAGMRLMGIDAPLVGFLTSAGILPSGSAVSLRGWAHAGFEPELALYLGSDVGPGAGPDTVAAAVKGIGLAIELVDNDLPLDDLAGIVGGNVFHRHLIVGEPDRTRGIDDVADLRLRVTNNGNEIGACRGHAASEGGLAQLAAHVAGWLAAAGTHLEAGQLILTGPVVPIVWARSGDSFQFHCEPLGRLDVRFVP